MALTKAKLIESVHPGDIGALPDTIGTVADKTLMTSIGGLVVAKTTQEAIAIWKVTNPNLLHNWDWRTPVNQRGSSGAISTGYVYDRWLRYVGTVTIGTGYLSFSSSAVRQFREGTGLSGKVVTASVMIGGVVYSATGTFPSIVGGYSDIAITGFGSARLGWDDNGLQYLAFISDATTRQVQAVKLELGTVSTLANDPPMEYGMELTKCLRYFNSGTSLQYYSRIVYSGTPTLVVLDIWLPVQMRIIPTLSITSYSGLLTAPWIGTWTPTSHTVDSGYTSKNLVRVNFSGNVPAGILFGGHLYSNAFSVSADL